MDTRTDRIRYLCLGVPAAFTFCFMAAVLAYVYGPVLNSIPNDPFTFKSCLLLTIWIVLCICSAPLVVGLAWGAAVTIVAVAARRWLSEDEMKAGFVMDSHLMNKWCIGPALRVAGIHM